jgi:hypothetical protein
MCPQAEPGNTVNQHQRHSTMAAKTATKVQKQFPSGVKLPPPLKVLCGYLDKFDYPISGCFEIDARGRETIRSWFRGDEKMEMRFAVFGKGSTGSTFALWLTDDLDAEEAPVIVLGSEGDFVVLAENVLEFCRLLGCGYDEVEAEDLSKAPSLAKETEPLRKWFAEHLAIKSPKNGKAIVSAAKKRYPKFAQHVSAWQKANL